MNTAIMPSTIERMHDELVKRNFFITDRSLRTIYFGGGTPSLLNPWQIQRFIDHACEFFDCSSLCEVTVEVNPDDVTSEYVTLLKGTSVNRISIGVQSLNDDELKFMSRRHDSTSAIEAVKRLQDAGYENISVDIIFGVPGFGSKILTDTIDGVLKMNVQHISAYHLSIVHGTLFGRMLEKGELNEVDEAESENEYSLLHSRLSESGFEHYEVSNYALPGFRSRHNESYWNSTQYLGIGPGAHSYNGIERVWCEQMPIKYVESSVYKSEQLSLTDRANEYIMTSLRTIEGLSYSHLYDIVKDRSKVESTKILTRQFIARGMVNDDGEHVKILPEYFLVSDSIIRTLFFDN